MESTFLKSVFLMLILLNPFLLIVYLLDLVQDLDLQSFSRTVIRAGLISGGVFLVFALAGDSIFRKLLQAHFASFQIFGGIIFLLIGIQFVFSGHKAMIKMRGDPEHIAGAIALPIMIGPGTVSASILAGSQLAPLPACVAIGVALTVTITTMILLKVLHDHVKPRNEKLIERYVEIMGRVTALVVGTYSIEMIMQGLRSWLVIFQGTV